MLSMGNSVYNKKNNGCFLKSLSLLLMLLFFASNSFADISGTVYESDGSTPLTGVSIEVTAYSGDPCDMFMEQGYALTDPADGTYTILGPPDGTYYLKTGNNNANYVNEWWAASASVIDCLGAESITVTAAAPVTGIDFQLDTGATISGIVYESDGTTPVTGESIQVIAYSGDPCGAYSSVGSANTNLTDGAYTINGLPPGTYYLRARDFLDGNYLDEWWASPASAIDCSGAQSTTVAAGEAVVDRDFQLDPPATISGTVYESDGTTPVTGQSIQVVAYSGDPCGGYFWETSTSTNSTDGTYTIAGLDAGTYFLRTDNNNTNYVNAWWASPASVIDCSGAQSITVTSGETVVDTNFQLDPGATISGIVYESDGVTPVTGVSIEVRAYSG